MSDELLLLVVPHTHWDREWYQTFQQFRARLLKCVNHLLRIFEHDPAFSNFLLDGQMIVLEDYLEIYPEEEEPLQHYARDGRLTVGPWYVQPDEFLVGGEALIRNLLTGRRLAQPYGGGMKIGYLPDSFGHIAQLPQILAGFAITSAAFWRGIGSEAPESEFWWTAPDGSRVLALHLGGEFGYANARDLPLDSDALVQRVERIVEHQQPRATTNVLLLMNGSDHLEPQDGLSAALAAANERLAQHHQRLLLGTLPDYVQMISKAQPELQTLTGELRSPEYAHLLPGVLSSRMWIKQRNAAAEEALIRWAEPVTAWAWTLGADYPLGLLRIAWRFLLQNQPHDSICGCSIDQVHREMRSRYDQCEQIAEQLTHDALQAIAHHVDTQTLASTMHVDPGHTIPIIVMNPTATRPSAPVALTLHAHIPPEAIVIQDERGTLVPHEVSVVGSTEILHQLIDIATVHAAIPLLEAGKVFDYYVVSLVVRDDMPDGIPHVWAVVSDTAPTRRHYGSETIARIQAIAQRPSVRFFAVTAVGEPQVSVHFLARDLPGFGGRTYLLRARRPDDPAPGPREITADETSLENAWLRVVVDPATGTFTVTDKTTSICYSDLHRFQDNGDVGDLYNYAPPESDMVITELARPPRIELLTSNSLQATLRVIYDLSLPARCRDNREARSPEYVTCSITTDITLIAGEHFVRLHTVVNNRAHDHRLRVLFPTTIATKVADAEGAFMVHRRLISHGGSTEDWQGWAEDPVNTQPQKSFISVSDGQRGMAILNRGLPEYEVLAAHNQSGVTIALTLMRCVGWLSRGDLAVRRGPAGPIIATPEAQMDGEWAFDYAILPHSGTWSQDDAFVQREAHAFVTDVRAMASDLHSGSIPSIWSFIQIEPASLTISTMKRAEDGTGFIVRWYNALDHAIEADIRTTLDFAQAETIALDEERGQLLQGEMDAPDHHWKVATPAGAIRTLRLRR